MLRSYHFARPPQRHLAGISRRLFPLWASSYRDSTTKFTPIPLREAMLGPANKQVGLFAAGVGLVFLVATRATHRD
jgi:hypothetical protein